MRFATAVLFLPLAAFGAEEVRPNDNRQPAGRLAGGVLALRLEVREALWNPEGENGPRIPVQVFAEQGKGATDPGPLIRVPAGTKLRVSVRNLLPSQTATVHRLGPTFEVAHGAVREVEFAAPPAGVYFYWASTTGAALDARFGVDGQLSGALVVDRPEGAREDRIFVLGHWAKQGDPKATPPVPDREAWVINGKSWPDTERLAYPAGGAVHWRWINSTDETHPLHMHGHYFSVEGKGDVKGWTTVEPARRHLAATQILNSGETMDIVWTPVRAGNWLFHCHVLFHVAPELRMTPAAHAGHAGINHMAGLVLGITVTQAKPVASAAAAPRKLQLTVGKRPGVDLHGDPGLGYRLGEGAFTAPGPPIVVTRGQPVEIAVHNQLAQATSVHWHGIELESYYDGVVGWGGEAKHSTPPVGPGETFVARFTPPRAGTFIYHTHFNDYVQLSTGLYGPLIVIEPGQRFDPQSDKVFVLSRGGTNDEKDPFLINGSASPAAMELKAGTLYRFRLIGITPAPHLDVKLEAGGHPAMWRAVAKDGAMLPPSVATPRTAEVTVFPGETYDFEFRPSAPGAMRLLAVQNYFKLQTAVPIVVKAR